MPSRLKTGFFFLAGIAILLHSACNNEKELSATGKQVAQDTRVMNASPGSQSEKLVIKILPENPVAASDLYAVYSYTGSTRVHLRWEQNGRVLEGENSARLFSNKRFSKADRISVTITAGEQSAFDQVEIKNTPPMVASVMLTPEFIFRGVDITATALGIDSDGDNIRFIYKWRVNDVDIPDSLPVLAGNQFKRGDRINITVTPFDSEGEGPSFVGKPVYIPNAPPRFLSSPQQVFKGEVYTYQAVAEDPDGDVLTYSLVSAPRGMSLDSRSGLITLKIAKEHAGVHQIEIAAQDADGSKVSQQFTLTLTIP